MFILIWYMASDLMSTLPGSSICRAVDPERANYTADPAGSGASPPAGSQASALLKTRSHARADLTGIPEETTIQGGTRGRVIDPKDHAENLR